MNGDDYGDEEDSRQKRSFWGYLLFICAFGGILYWTKTSWDSFLG